MRSNSSLVFIPVYNEAAHLKGLLERLRLVYSGDVLFVDDGSCDGSQEILSSLEGPRTRVITQAENRGYGATLIRGFKEALSLNYQLLITMDSDGQHRPDWVPVFLNALHNAALKVDIISGSRYLAASSSSGAVPADRHAINRKITELLNRITGFNITDAFCGFKGYRVESLRRLELRESGYSMPLQLWIQAKHFDFKVSELPVSRIYDDPNRSFGGGLDDPRRRLEYYLETIRGECNRWGMRFPGLDYD